MSDWSRLDVRVSGGRFIISAASRCHWCFWDLSSWRSMNLVAHKDLEGKSKIG
jgi:hypothetical protein